MIRRLKVTVWTVVGAVCGFVLLYLTHSTPLKPAEGRIPHKPHLIHYNPSLIPTIEPESPHSDVSNQPVTIEMNSQQSATDLEGENEEGSNWKQGEETNVDGNVPQVDTEGFWNLAEWNPGYKLPTGCYTRKNITNPKESIFPCPVNATFQFGKEPLYKGPGKPGSVWCDPVTKHCQWENVCVKRLSTKGKYTYVTFFEAPENLSVQNVSWRGWNDLLQDKEKTFSWHFAINFTAEPPPEEVLWIKGTNMWFDQAFANFCHIGIVTCMSVQLAGHGMEFYLKIGELRRLFPGKVDRIIFAHDVETSEYHGSPYKFCHLQCYMLMIGFEQENYQFPPIYWLTHQKEFKYQLICMEKVLVPADTHQFFSSQESADSHREAALRMCKIPPRNPTEPKNILFLQRGFDRQIANADDMCLNLRGMGKHAYLEILDDMGDFCQQIATVYSADIIVSIVGSSNYILPYARPGSVVIFVYSFHFQIPDWKILAYYASLRSLEIVTLNVSLTLHHEGYKHTNKTIEQMNKGHLECFNFGCRYYLRHRDVIVPQQTMEWFLDEAVSIWNDLNFDQCEIPPPWPVPIPAKAWKSKYFWIWRNNGYELNFNVCEPPPPHCICCQDQECDMAAHLERPF